MISAVHIVSLSHFSSLRAGIAVGTQFLKYVLKEVIYEQGKA